MQCFLREIAIERLSGEAARLKRWEFMLSWTVLRIPGGTASPFTALATF